MARLKSGILDGFSGKVGKVVGGTWRGVDYMRSVGSKRSNAKTANQEQQQAKFKVASEFSTSMSDLFTLGFKDYAVRMTGRNYGQSLILTNAIEGTNPDFKIAYDRVLVSKGSLPNIEGPAASSPKESILQITWSGTEENGKEKPTDVAILVAYCPELKRSVFKHSATRDTGIAELNVPKFKGRKVQTWITFMSANGKLLATSVYCGEVTIT